MEKVYGSPKRQDGLYKVGLNTYELIYGFGKENPDDETGWNWRERFTGKPSLETIYETIQKTIDEEADRKIIYGMEWKGFPVKLDTEAQTNILGLLVNLPYDDGSMFPMNFKLGDYPDGSPAFYQFQNALELAEFAKAATEYKQSCYAECWGEKEQMKTIDFTTIL